VPRRDAVLHTIPSPRTSIALVAAACLLLVASSLAAWRLEALHPSDIAFYTAYGDLSRSGELPYRDFRIEYPPGALPAIVLPTLLDSPSWPTDGAIETHSLSIRDYAEERSLPIPDSAEARSLPFHDYAESFALLMLVIWLATIIGMGVCLAGLRATLPHWALALGIVAVSPLLLGQMIIYGHYDPWPALLTTSAVAAMVYGRRSLAALVLGLGIAAKLYPVVLLPPLVILAWRRGGGRAAASAVAVTLGTTLAAFLPFLVLAPGNTWWALKAQLARGVQIESTASALATAILNATLKADVEGIHVPVPTLSVTGDPTGINAATLAGTLVEVLAVGSGVVGAAVLILIWARFARSRASGAEVVLASAAAVTAVLAFGRVLSPQYLVWVMPLVLLVGGRRGLAAGVLLVLAAVVTYVWTHSFYDSFAYKQTVAPTLVLLLRNGLLIALVGVLAWPTRVWGPGQWRSQRVST
jgi:Glycosyltransferase family 87